MSDRPRPPQNTETPVGSLRRRDVLALGSAAAVALWLDGFPGAATARAQESTGERPLSIGYVRGSDGWPDLRALPWSASGITEGAGPVEVVSLAAARAEAALSAAASDRALVTVRGLYPAVPPAIEAGYRTIGLDVLFPTPGIGAGGRSPFHAWSFERRAATSVSPPVRFVVPTDGGGVYFSISVDPADLAPGAAKAGRRRLVQPSPAARLSGSLVRGGTAGPIVARGVYLLGLGTGSWDRGGVLQPALDALEPALLSIVVTVDPLPAEASS